MKLAYSVFAQQRNNPKSKMTKLASFAIVTDMHVYADKVRKDNPTWIVEERYSSVKYSK